VLSTNSVVVRGFHVDDPLVGPSMPTRMTSSAVVLMPPRPLGLEEQGLVALRYEGELGVKPSGLESGGAVREQPELVRITVGGWA